MSKELKDDPEDDATKVSLFRQILKFRYQARLNKRYYSYYRVVQATLESFVVLTVLLLIMVVAPAPNRLTRNNRNLWKIVAEKLAEFLDANRTQDNGLIGTLDLTNSLAFYSAVLYSVTMIITAIARYVFQVISDNYLITTELILID